MPRKTPESPIGPEKGEKEPEEKQAAKKRKRKTKTKEVAPKESSFSEEEALELLKTRNIEPLLESALKERKITESEADQARSLLRRLEGTLDFLSRGKILTVARRELNFSDAIFSAFANAILQEDREGIPPEEVLKYFIRKAGNLIAVSAGRKVSEAEAEKVRFELEELGEDVKRFVRTSLGSEALAAAEKEDFRPENTARIMEAVRIVLGEEQAELLESTVKGYAAMHLRSGFEVSTREERAPLYKDESIYEVWSKLRDFLGESGAPAEEKAELVKYRSILESYLSDRAEISIRSFVKNIIKRDRHQAERSAKVKSLVGLIENTRRAFPKEAADIAYQQAEEVKQRLRLTIDLVASASSIPLLETYLKRILSLNDQLVRLGAEWEQASKTRETIPEAEVPSPEAMRREAEALMREIEARDIEAEIQDLRDRLRRATSPREKAGLLDDIRVLERKAEPFYRRAEEIRRSNV